MTIMVAEVFDALRSAGADEEKARAAAIAVAAAQLDHPRAENGSGQRALPAPVESGEPSWDPRVDQIEQQVETRIGSVERGFAARLSQSERTVETRFERNDSRHAKLDERLKRIEKRIDSDTRSGAWLKWLVALLLLLQAASFYLMWRILLSLPSEAGGL